MKICFVSAVLIMLFTIHALNSQSRQPVNFTLKETSITFNDSQKVNLSEKSPLLAGTLSFIVPGFALGQIYNGQINKFFVHSLITTGLLLSFFSSGGEFEDINIFGDLFSHERTITILSTAFLLAYSTNWIWSVVDASVSANKINKQIHLQKYRSDVMDKMRFGFTVNKNKQLNLKFAFDL